MTNAAVSTPSTSAVRALARDRRLAIVSFGVAAFWAGSALIVRTLHALSATHVTAVLHIAVAAVLGAVAMLLACSIVERLVHGKLMHRRSRWPLVHLAYDLHHRAHHWIHYPPDAYVQDEVTYVPLVPPRPERACRTRPKPSPPRSARHFSMHRFRCLWFPSPAWRPPASRSSHPPP